MAWLRAIILSLLLAALGVGGWMAYRGTASNRRMLLVPAAFGLVHGLGFAAAVSDRLKEWDHGSIVRILVGFNVGVELAQICILIGAAWRLR